MAYNTKAIVKDVNGKPIPQYYNPETDQYEVLQGHDGANRVELYDAAGNPVDIKTLLDNANSKLQVMGEILADLDIKSGSKTDLAEIDPTQPVTMISIMKGILARQQLLEEKMAKPVKLDGSTMEHYGKSTDTKPTTDIIIGATYFEIDTSEVYMWDGTSWVVI
jgi:hypothetical protein